MSCNFDVNKRVLPKLRAPAVAHIVSISCPGQLVNIAGIDARRHWLEQDRCKSNGREACDEQRAVEECELHAEFAVLATMVSRCCIVVTIVSKGWRVRIWLQLTFVCLFEVAQDPPTCTSR
jgi:hypothetical protein